MYIQKCTYIHIYAYIYIQTQTPPLKKYSDLCYIPVYITRFTWANGIKEGISSWRFNLRHAFMSAHCLNHFFFFFS